MILEDIKNQSWRGGGGEAGNYLLPQNIEFYCSFVLGGNLHQCCKSKLSFFPRWGYILWHNFCEIYKLDTERGRELMKKIKQNLHGRRSGKYTYIKCICMHLCGHTYRYVCMHVRWMEVIVLRLTWKLSNARDGILSSNSLIISQGPSPTPTKTIERGNLLQWNKSIYEYHMDTSAWSYRVKGGARGM